jgi:DNA ligase D-like protein (predicted 3'-phosphoesterase)
MLRRTKKFLNEVLVPLEEGDRGLFVIQHHWATQEHWDLRLEWPVAEGVDINEVLVKEWEGKAVDEGDVLTRVKRRVLRSWAIPKHRLPRRVGERLMMSETELHPWEYKDFEGEIPEGKYGAGVVEIYDSGEYEVLDYKPDEDRLVVYLRGDRIDDVFAFVPAFRGEGKGNQWLVIKVDKRKWLSREASVVVAVHGLAGSLLRRAIRKDWTREGLEELSDKELQMDHFLCHVGVRAIREGSGFGDWTIKELKELHDALVEEAARRELDWGLEHETPLE